MATLFPMKPRPEQRYTGVWWFDGSESDWRALPRTEREALSLANTNCLFAFPSWGRSTTGGCVHVDCRIARGEVRPITRVNAQLKGEAQSGWLRFVTDRDKLAAIFRVHRAIARQTGTYDIWSKEAWGLTVSAGIGA